MAFAAQPSTSVGVKKQENIWEPEGHCSDQSTLAMTQSSDSTVTQTAEDVGKTQESKICAQPDVKECFKVLSSGPQFAVSNCAHILFEQYCKKVMSAFSMKFHSTSGKEEHEQNSSSVKVY